MRADDESSETDQNNIFDAFFLVFYSHGAKVITLFTKSSTKRHHFL